MIYYPYLRGKQYELMLLREQSDLIADKEFCPIIEPVRENLSSLQRAIEKMIQSEANFTVVSNPQVGELQSDNFLRPIEDLIWDYENATSGLIAGHSVDLNDIESHLVRNSNKEFTIIHAGYDNAAAISSALSTHENIREHVFLERLTGRLYRKRFLGSQKPLILINDPFIQRKNAEYPESEHFSDLHITFVDEQMHGFGDYSIVGDEFSEYGGPAHAVAIHLTYFDQSNDMHIYHFVSDQRKSPTNIAKKFLEAVSKLVATVYSDTSIVFRSSACEEFKKLFENQHFPGLGKVKQLSMQHHLELLAQFNFDSQR